MEGKYVDLLKSKMSGESFAKLEALENEKLTNWLGERIEHMNPKSVYFCDDSEEDAEYIRQESLRRGEEKKLAKDGQTIHWDGYGDQARDKANTKFMIPAEKLEEYGTLNTIEWQEGKNEIEEISKNIYDGKDVIVKLFAEGPTHSPFTIPCVQITDSCYVAHSEDILYRRAYSHFKTMENKDDFFRFCHSAGVLDENMHTVNLDKRRIYQDLENNIVYSMNAQYAGNSVGLKKHSMRLAINKSGKEGWLCEHMFLMNISNSGKGRDTYFAGAFPSACGKTSTAMIPGEKIVGDDIAYFRNVDDKFMAVNVENGIFGIIRDVNAKDDPQIFKSLGDEKEMIFSNILMGPDGEPYWAGCEKDNVPKEGYNHSGEWQEGKKDADGKEIPIAHPNSRFTMRLEYLDNIDPAFNDKNGVEVEGVVYGGRDSDTTVPCEESRDWKEGIILKAIPLESETTAATLGAQGVRVPQPMANLDFISYPLGQYFDNNIKFVEGMKKVPKVFSVNYFMTGTDGKIVTSKLAKKVWMHWFEGRVHGEYEAYETPTGFIPKYDDLKVLFKDLINEDFAKEDYDYLFTFRCDKWLEKIERAETYFTEKYSGIPSYIFNAWKEFKNKISEVKSKYGAEVLPGTYNG